MNATKLLPRASARAAALVAVVLGLAGCPLQTPTFETGTPGLVMSASSASPLVDDTIVLTALAPAGGIDLASAKWSTNDASILRLGATSGASITATALKIGTARIIALANGYQAAVTVTVLDSPAAVAVAGPATLARGDVATYSATVMDIAGRTVTATPVWAASGAVALDEPGANAGTSIRVRAVAVGAGAVTAQAGGRSAQLAVEVVASHGKLVVRLADGTAVPASVALGDALALAAEYDGTNGPVDDTVWSTSGPCASVGASGPNVSVVEKGAGTCTVTAQSKGMTASATLSIVTVTGIKIAGDASPFTIGEARTFMAVGVAGMAESNSTVVTWSTPDEQVLTLQPSGTSVTVTAIGVGEAQLFANLGNNAMASVDLLVAPVMIQISAPGTRVLSGASTTVTARAFGQRGAAARFTSPNSLSLSGASGFATVGPGVVQSDGSVTFALAGAKGDSPNVTVSFGGVVMSNALSFTIAQIAGVVVNGPQGPVRVGSPVNFTAVPVDASGAPIDADLTATWADATGVYQFPADSTGLAVMGNVVKLGTSAIVATVAGVASAPFASPAQPAMVALAPFSPASIAVGGTATAALTILDANSVPIPGVPLSQVSLKAADGTKISLDAGVVMGMGFLFTATGLAPTDAAGVAVTATWTDGMYPVDSGAVPLVVTGP